MRIILALLLTFTGVRAETINFICEPAEYVFMNKFFAQGSMIVEAGSEGTEILSNTKAILSFRLVKVGNTPEYRDFVGQMLEGDTKYISSMTKTPFILTQFLLNEDSAHFDLKFLFDYSDKFDSRIKDVDTGHVYRANCRVTK